MTIINGNSSLNNLYKLYKDYQNGNATQKEIDSAASKAGAKLFDVVGKEDGGDGKLRYDDIIALMQGVDLDGDGEVSDNEKNFIMDLLNGIVSSKTNISSKYSQSSDTSLDSVKNSETAFADLNYILTENDTTDTKLGSVLTKISTEYVKNMYGIETEKTYNKKGKVTSSTWLSQSNINTLQNLEAQLDAINDYLNENLEEGKKPTDEQMKKLFGDIDLSSLGSEDDTTISTLETAINTIKEVMGLNKKLSTSTQKRIDNMKTASGIDSWENALLKQQFNSNGSYFDGVGGNVNFTANFDLNGDKGFNYKDLVEFANFDFDANGDGDTSAAEQALADSLRSKLLSQYKINQDTDLKNVKNDADGLAALSEFMDNIQDSGNIYSSSDSLNKVLEQINERLNNNIFSVGTANSINQKTVTQIAKLEAELTAVTYAVDGKITEAELQKIYGENSKGTAEYQKQLKNAILSLQEQMGIEDGNIENLSSTNQTNYNKYLTKAQATAEVKNLDATQIKNIGAILNTTDATLKTALDGLSDKEKELIKTGQVDLTETFPDSDQKKYVLAKGSDDGQWHIYKFDDCNAKQGTAALTVINGKKAFATGNNNLYIKTGKTNDCVESQLVYASSKTETEKQTQTVTETKLHDETKPANALVDDPSGATHKELNPQDQWIPNKIQNPDPMVPIDDPDVTTETRTWITTNLVNGTGNNITEKDNMDSALVGNLGLDYKKLNLNDAECSDKLTEATTEAIAKYRKDNENRPIGEIAIAEAKIEFIENIWKELTPTEFADEFKKAYIDPIPDKMTETEFNNLSADEKKAYELTEAEIAEKKYSSSYEKYATLWAIGVSDQISVTMNILDKIVEAMNTLGKIDDPDWKSEIDDPNKDNWTKTYSDVPNQIPNQYTVEVEKEVDVEVTTYSGSRDTTAYYTQSPLVVADPNGNVNTGDKVTYNIDGIKANGDETINNTSNLMFVLDTDHDGISGEDGGELLGNNTDLDNDGKADGYANGFEALWALGVKEGILGGDDLTLDANDIALLEQKWGFKLRVGYDGEVKSFKDVYGSASIHFGTSRETQTTKNFDGKGNDVMFAGVTIKTADGKSIQIADLWNRVYENEDGK